MSQNENGSLSIAIAIQRHVRLFKETVVPWQTISGLAWVLAGVCSSTEPIKIFSDWTIIPLVLAVITARFSGMCWNRLIDWQLDARNPRTARRALPSRRISPKELAAYALITLSLFLVSCSFLSNSGRWMGIFISIVVLLYSFTKRFTIGCHFLLGLIHACLPIAGSICQCGSVTLSASLLSIAAFSSVSGSDILYALQDEFFDRKFGLFSIPARFGTESSLETASALHAIAITACTFAFIKADLSLICFALWGISVIFLLGVWRRIWKDPADSIAKAFPILLSSFSLASFITLAVDRIWKALS